MATFQIDLTQSAETFYEEHGVNISSQTAIVGLVKVFKVHETQTITAQFTWYLSASARNLGAKPLRIIRIEGGQQVMLPKQIDQVVGASWGTLDSNAELTAITNRIEDPAGAFQFGVGSVTVV